MVVYEGSTAVINLVDNSGSPNTALVSQNDAIAHFENNLVDNGIECKSKTNITGVWPTDQTDNDLLAFVFFANGTYVHIEVDEELPIDAPGEISGMEWGTYSRNSTTGQLTITQIFDGNGGTGLNDFVGQTNLFAKVSGDVLTLEFDNNQNGIIETDESLAFQRQ